MPIVSNKWLAGGRVRSPIVVTDVSHLGLQNAAETLARQFKREGRFDFAPYTANTHGSTQEVWLLPARTVAIGYSQAIAGAIGIVMRPSGWMIHWVWIHPYERKTGLIDTVWPQLVQQYPGLDFEGPFTHDGARLVLRLTGREVPAISRAGRR